MKKQKSIREKILIFDASSIITLALNNLLYVLRKLKKYPVRFIITQDVRREVIDKPLGIKRYELEALMIQQLAKENVLEMPERIGIDSRKISKEINKIMRIANNTFEAGRRFIHIISAGEASCFALSKILKEEGIASILAIDERTARMLAEKPENLHKLLEKKLHTKIRARKDNFSYFAGFRIIRSAEICYVAYKRGLVGITDGRQLVDALLYATKYKGCSISRLEIEEVKSIV